MVLPIPPHFIFLIIACTGHPVKGSWVVAVRDSDGKIRAEVVADRSTVRLTRFIETYVRPGSWLHSDYWRGYANGTSNTQNILGAMGIQGLSVNHDITFKQWVANHRKYACTNSIEGDWNAFILKTPKRNYGFKYITPYLRQIEWDRECTNVWTDWWKALESCTKEKAVQFCQELDTLHATDPNLPKPTHPLLQTYTRGFHTTAGNNVGKQTSKSRWHYAYCSTSNPNYRGCIKCDFYWGQYCVGDVDLIKEARKAAYLDEKEKEKRKKNMSSKTSQDGTANASEVDPTVKNKNKKSDPTRLSLVIRAVEEAYEKAQEARRLAMEAKMATRKVAAIDNESVADEDDDSDDDDEIDPFADEGDKEDQEVEGKAVQTDEDDD